MHGDAKRRSSGQDVILRGGFIEHLQRSHRPRHLLYLIENDERILGSDPSSGLDRQCGNQPFHIQIRIKQHTHVGIVEKCDTAAIRKVLDNL